MRILVLHRIPYKYIRYADGIDHGAHEVTYVGIAERLADLPEGLSCRRIARPGTGDIAAEVLAAIATEPAPDLVISLSEYELLSAAEIRAALGVPGDRLEDVIPVRDKVVMKTLVAQAGLRVPQFVPLPSALAAEADIPWTGTTVLKPTAGAASEGIAILPTRDAALGLARERKLSGPEASGWEIEEYIEGPILHVDGLVVDGQPVAVQASRYVGTCLDYVTGEPVGSVQIDTPPALVSWVMRGLDAVGIRTGLYHLEAIESPDGLVFLEVGARFGGGDIVDTFELATGVHLPSTLLRIITGLDDPIPTPRPADPGSRYGWFVWPGHHLEAPRCRIVGEERFSRSDLVRRWVQLAPERAVKPTISFADIELPLAGVVGGAPSDVLERFLSDLFDTVQVTPCSSPELTHV